MSDRATVNRVVAFTVLSLSYRETMLLRDNLRGVYSDTTQLDVKLSSVELCRYKRACTQLSYIAARRCISLNILVSVKVIRIYN